MSVHRLPGLILFFIGFTHDAKNYVCLRKGLYGLKQSGNLWFNEASKACKKLGLVQSLYDPALFHNAQKGLYVTLYVDDFKIIGPVLKKVLAFKREFGNVYKIKDFIRR